MYVGVQKFLLTMLSSSQTLSLAQEKLNVGRKRKAKVELRLDCKSKINNCKPKICDEL